MAMHEDQLDVVEKTVRRLVHERLPRWRELAVRELPAAGTVNAIFRIGDHLAARFLAARTCRNRRRSRWFDRVR